MTNTIKYKGVDYPTQEIDEYTRPDTVLMVRHTFRPYDDELTFEIPDTFLAEHFDIINKNGDYRDLDDFCKMYDQDVDAEFVYNLAKEKGVMYNEYVLIQPRKTLKVRMYVNAFCDTQIEVPEDMDIDEAFKFAQNNIELIPVTDLEHIDGGDELDEIDIETDAIYFEENNEGDSNVK